MLDMIKTQVAKQRVIALKKELKTIVKTTLTSVFGQKADYLPILECVMVGNPEDASLVPSVPKLIAE